MAKSLISLMRKMYLLSAITVCASLVGLTSTHPGDDSELEIQIREEALRGMPLDLSHCSYKMKVRGVTVDAVERRTKIAREARISRGLNADTPFLKARDAPTVLTTDHKSEFAYTSVTSESLLFSEVGAYILQPEITEGPYWVAGEYIRSDIRDGQEGVELILDIQVVDIVTCEPVDNTLVELWQANSTGVYGGVVKRGNGAGLDDSSNILTTQLRGLQHTDSQGVTQFTTIFPGHYTGRSPYIHVLTLLNGEVLENGHYNGGTKAHVGQLFFDQSLITEVEKSAPYNTNTQELRTNADDSIFLQEVASSDPVVHYSLLGSEVSEGLFAWVTFGVHKTTSLTINQAGSLDASVTVSDAGQQVTGVA